MKHIKCSNSNKEILVDDEDYERLSAFPWAVTESGHVKRSYRVSYRTHNVSVACEIMQKRGVLFDHIDRNPLNNQKANLRIASVAENGWNRSKHKIGSSKYKGVSWDKGINKWRVVIHKNKHKMSIGYFKFEKAAALAYDYAALRLFGEFAHTNLIK